MSPSTPAKAAQTPRSLALAGLQMSRRPSTSGAKPTMHESCLREAWQRREPTLPSIVAVKASLEDDAVRQAQKYQGAVPSCDSARFTVALPRSPQNMKFCSVPGLVSAQPSAMTILEEVASADGSQSGSQTSSVHMTHRPTKRFDVKTLRMWFCDIDADESGSISQRKFIHALRQHKDMQALLCNNLEGESDVVQVQHVESCASRASDSTKAWRKEVASIRKIIREIDTDGSGTVEWAEFVEFFCRTGLFLEYKTKESFNTFDVGL